MIQPLRKHSFFKSLMLAAACLAGGSASAQYCAAGYNYPCGYWGGHMHIKSFSTTGGSTNITSTNTGCSNSSGYTYYSTRVHTGVQGNTVNFSIANCPYYTMNYKIWVDFNIDGDFTDAGEEVYSQQIQWGQSATGNFQIPITATPGNSRLRVRAVPSWYSPPGPCGTIYYGETEDYLFVINAACSTTFTQKIDPYTFACTDGPGTITVNAANGQSYQWQVQNGSTFVNLTNGGNYSSVNSKTLQLHNIPATMAGTKYRCVVTPTCGSFGTAFSDTVALNIRPAVKITSQSTADTSCISLSTILSYKTSEPALAGRWQIKSATGGGYVDITGPQFTQTDDSLFIVNIPDTLNGAKIRCIFTTVCGDDTTDDMTMFVNTIPTVVGHPQDAHVAQGATTNFSTIAAGIGVKYQWQVGVNGKFANVNDNSIYNGVKTNTLRMKGISYAQNQFEFRCVVMGSGSCRAGDTSQIAVLTVDPPASVEDVLTENSISLFPNPASGQEVTIKTDVVVASFLSTYTVTDKLGKTIMVGNVDEKGNGTTVNISKLVPDVYFIQVMDKDNTIVKSLKFTKI